MADQQSTPNVHSHSGEVAMLAVALPIVLLQMPFLLSSMRASWEELRRLLSAALRPCAPDMGSVVSKDSALESRVAAGFRERLDANTCSAVRVLAPSMGALLAIMCFNLGTQRSRALSDVQTWLFIGFAAALTAASAYPSVVSARRTGLLYGGVMAFACAFVATGQKIPMYVFVSDGFTLLLRLGLSVRYTSVTPVALWNALYILASTYAYRQAVGDAFVSMVVPGQVWSASTVMILCVAAARATEADVRREVEASMLRSESSGLWALLDMVCDVVVPLGEDLKIVDKASRFAAMVTLQVGSVEGARLQDFMPSLEDQAAFERCVRAHQEDSNGLAGALPRALHAKLRDSLGNLISAELFCVTLQSPVQRRFFVGIREFSDHTPLPECRAPRGGAGRGAWQRRAPLGGGVSDEASSSDGGESDSPPPVRPGPAAPPPPPADLRPTPDLGVDLGLVELMKLCALPAAPGACCPLHLRVRHLQERLGSVGCLDCAPAFGPQCVAQCPECGLLVKGAVHQQCFACGVAVRAPPTRLAGSLAL